MTKTVDKAFRIKLYEDAVKKEKLVRKESHIKYGLNIDVMDLEELFRKDMDEGLGFIIDPSFAYNDISSDWTELVDGDSLYSYKFSIRSNDTHYAKTHRYRCKCGEEKSELAGVMCPKCGTETYNHIAIRGWFDLGEYKVFNPFYWNRFISNCKNVALAELSVQAKSAKKQAIKSKLHGVDRKSAPPNILKDIEKIEGVPSLLDLQDENVLYKFIEEYAADDSVKYLLDNIDKAMTSKIPVLNKNMINTSIRVGLDAVSNTKRDPKAMHYVVMSNKINILNKMISGYSPDKSLLSVLLGINNDYSQLFDAIIATLGKGKESMIRGKVGGRRKGYSCRLVLEGYINHKVDEAAMPYKFFGQMTIDYHYDLYDKLGVTPEASFRIRNNIPNKADKIMMDSVLKELTKDNLNVIIALRQPAIYRESMVALRLMELHEEDVIRVNEMVIDSCMVGDKDGDVVSVFMPDPSIRTQLLFSMSPNKRIFNPLTVSVEPAMELVEAGYVNVCLVLPKERKGSIIVTKEELKKMGYDVGD